MIAGPAGVLMRFFFRDNFCVVVRLPELAPKNPYQAILSYLVDRHGPVVDITEVDRPANPQNGQTREAA